jgi:hypothetical protein
MDGHIHQFWVRTQVAHAPPRASGPGSRQLRLDDRQVLLDGRPR